MKILLVHNKYQQKGGEDIVFEAEARMLSNHGHQVITMVFDNNLIKGYQKFSSFFNSFFSIHSFIKIIKTMKKENPDVLHIHNMFFKASPSVIYAAKFCRIPVILTLHNFRLICPSGTLLHEGKIFEDSLKEYFPLTAVRKKVYRNSTYQTLALALNLTFNKSIGTWNRIDKYIFLTHFSKDIFKRSTLKIDEKKFVVKPNFVEDKGFNLIKDEYYIFIGRLSEEKGVDVMLDAFSKMDKELIIVGSGPKDKKTRDISLAKDNINFVGNKPHDEVIGLLKNAKALIFPSIWYETFGMTVIEAFSCATPVIASKIGSMNELINPGVNGLFFEPGNCDSLMDAICELEQNLEAQKNMRRNARDSFEKNFSCEINYPQIIAIYESTLNSAELGASL
ncbi:glycosyltransferase family 4 protein [Pleomorphovibrio marinus]|uniref:glycosyltransferase family 4 protein n=1 Tax=Pleomorphovibrio marinus TaxID=2164132 RepID=UPI000E0BACBB|nr:glycosyltransferase family 4 protein [Pleomorphovibrio marinus]